MRYCVANRYRQGIDAKWLNEEFSNGRLRLVFDTYAEANKYLRQCFFDDSDYGVFGRMSDGKWLRCFSDARREIVQ